MELLRDTRIYAERESRLQWNIFPWAKMAKVKLLLKVSATKKWSLTQRDISNVFLNEDLDEEIFMKIP